MKPKAAFTPTHTAALGFTPTYRMKGAEGGESVGEGDEVLDLDICPGTPQFLVTPLIHVHKGS